MKHPTPHDRTVRRAALPEVMLLQDVALALDLPESDAECLLKSGRIGPAFEVQGRQAVLRSSFLTALEQPYADRATNEGGAR